MKLLKCFSGLFLSICLFSLAGNLSPVNAQMDCQNVAIVPPSGTTTTSYNITASSGCTTNGGYRIVVYDENGSEVFGSNSPIFPVNQQIVPGPDNGFGPFIVPGNYRVSFRPWFPPFDDQINIPLPIVAAGSTVYQCAQQVPLNTPNCASGTTQSCCPIGCPYDGTALPGDQNVTPRCGCGGEGNLICPDNILGLPQCQVGLVPNFVSNTCEAPPSNALSYYCGETIDPADISRAVCEEGDCPLSLKSGGGYWCACGKAGQACCPQGEDLADRPNAPAMPLCEGTNLTCVASGSLGTCIQPVTTPDIFCANEDYIRTAIGCIPYTNINSLISFFVKWAVRFASGVAFLLFIIASGIVTLSTGDPDRLQSGKDLLGSAIAGVFMIIFSLFILRFIGFNVLGIFI